MDQLILHLIGDFWLQTSWMAYGKMKSTVIALIHALVYTIPFLLLTDSPPALLVIWLTHAAIDRTSVAKRFALWRLPKEMPEYLSIWIAIIYDNSLHLTINFLAISYM